MRSSRSNEKEILKCLHELTRSVERINTLIEKNMANKVNVVNQIKGDIASLKDKLNRLDIRIGNV